MKTHQRVTCLSALLGVTMISCAVAPARAQVLQSGDIVVGGMPAGYQTGVIWRIRNGAITPTFESNLYKNPRDMIVDPQGRLVFMASPDANGWGLFRIDPASGSIERLFHVQHYVQLGDTLPDGMPDGVQGFDLLGSSQSLHTEHTYSVSISDDANGGWPEVHVEDAYAWEMAVTTDPDVGHGHFFPMAFQYLPSTGRAQVGIDVSKIHTPYLSMTGGGNDIWYGGIGKIAYAKPDLILKVHMKVGDTYVDALLRVTLTNEIKYDGLVLDNLQIPNVTVKCGNLTDDNVPLQGGSLYGMDFYELGLIGGALYTAGGAGVSYNFSIQPRDPCLNPGDCSYYGAVTMDGPIPPTLSDGTGTYPDFSSTDGGQVLARVNYSIQQVNPAGGVTVINDGTDGLLKSGRPLRWTGGSSPALATSVKSSAVVDTAMSSLVVRVDSLANVLVTGPAGKKIGYNVNGSTVNDFGAAGLVSSLGPTGWPHLIVLANPTPGTYYTQIAGLGAGNYGVTAYLAHTVAGGIAASTSGSASAGSLVNRALQVGAPLSLSWSSGDVGVSPGSAPGPSFGFDRVGPVPSSDQVRFSCRIPASGVVSLEIFDAAGRRVREVTRGERSAGGFEVSWRGETDDGRAASPGIYLARLSMLGRSAVRHIAITH